MTSVFTGRTAQLLVLLVAIFFVTPHVWFWKQHGRDADDWEAQILEQAKLYRKKQNIMPSSSSHSLPLQDVTILITGATSGIGKGLTLWTLEQGATVVAMGRSPSKLNDLAREAADAKPQQLLFTVTADFSDLTTVSTAVDKMQAWAAANNSDFPTHFDLVVCNAGIHTGFSTIMDPYQSTAQGYDLTFGVNYLSHFLLTEKLLEKTSLLNNGTRPSKIVHVTSSFHFAVEGSDLWPGQNWASVQNRNRDPVASQLGGNHGFVVYRSQRQYANSKLAQILHARYYNNNQHKKSIKSVTACPAWVGTSIIQADYESLSARIFRYLAFPADGYGLSSILAAMFSSDDNNTGMDDDYYVNTQITQVAWKLERVLWSGTSSSSDGYDHSGARAVVSLRQKLLYHWTPLLDVMAFSGAMFMLQWQRLFPAVMTATSSSQVSYDTDLQEEFYNWSRQAVKEYL